MEATQWVMSRVTEMTNRRVGMEESSTVADPSAALMPSMSRVRSSGKARDQQMKATACQDMVM